MARATEREDVARDLRRALADVEEVVTLITEEIESLECSYDPVSDPYAKRMHDVVRRAYDFRNDMKEKL